ncbi:hypothetical protein BDZ89DRAFT_1147866 [Hymenopellis radicata]|nr:hypothetical protein BDZ89DRAFT_1147866 [Hymenopellis radicata]
MSERLPIISRSSSRLPHLSISTRSIPLAQPNIDLLGRVIKQQQMDDAELLRQPPHDSVGAATEWFDFMDNKFDYSQVDFNSISLDNLPPIPAALQGLYSLDEQDNVPGPSTYGNPTPSAASAILPDARQPLRTSSLPHPLHPEPTSTTLIPLSLLERDTHETRQRMEKQWMEGKATVDSYQRHFNNYDSYIARLNQENLNRPDWVLVTAHPITRTKVAKFLEYETARTKRTRAGEVIANSSLGAESIKQAISALEYARKNHVHEDAYRQCPESQLKLREDPRIQTFQKAALANEANRRSKGHVLKAQGPQITPINHRISQRLAYSLTGIGATSDCDSDSTLAQAS